jgi:hypothetical protein
LVKFDLFWEFDRFSKKEHKRKSILQDLGPFLGIFGFLGSCNGYGNVSPWVYPCLGLFCNIYRKLGEVIKISLKEWLSARVRSV